MLWELTGHGGVCCPGAEQGCSEHSVSVGKCVEWCVTPGHKAPYPWGRCQPRGGQAIAKAWALSRDLLCLLVLSPGNGPLVQGLEAPLGVGAMVEHLPQLPVCPLPGPVLPVFCFYLGSWDPDPAGGCQVLWAWGWCT